MDLYSDQLFNDPRIAQAKALVLAALMEHQESIRGVRGPDPDRADAYQSAIDQLSRERGGLLYYPYLSSGLGNGALVQLLDGSVKYDFINGIGAHFGHSLPGIVDATFDGIFSDTVMQGNLQQSKPSADLIHLLVTVSGMDHCFLTTSGAMAAENALKMAFQATGGRRILAFDGCFMGRTIALASVTDKAAYRDGLPMALDVDHIPFYSADDPDGSTQRAVDRLKQLLARYPKDHAAMVFELVQGEGGYYTAPREFFKVLMAELRSHGVAVICDEIQTFGRLSQLFAFQHFQLEEFVDIVLVGKITQVCATLFTRRFNPKPGLVSQTFTGSTTAILASIYIIQNLRSGGNLGADGTNMSLGRYFSDRLAGLARRFPDKISGPYGLGMMVAFTPYRGNPALVKQFSMDLYHAGVIGFTAGGAVMRMRFLPPLGATSVADIDRVIDIISSVLELGE